MVGMGKDIVDGMIDLRVDAKVCARKRRYGQ